LLKLKDSGWNRFISLFTESGPKWSYDSNGDPILDGNGNNVPDLTTSPDITFEGSSNNYVETSETGSSYYIVVNEDSNSSINTVDRGIYGKSEERNANISLGTNISSFADYSDIYNNKAIIDIVPPAISTQNRKGSENDYSIAVKTNSIHLKRTITSSVLDSLDRLVLDGGSGNIYIGNGTNELQKLIHAFRKSATLHVNDTFASLPSDAEPIYLKTGFNTINIDYYLLSETDYKIYETGNCKILLEYNYTDGSYSIKKNELNRGASDFDSSEFGVYTSTLGLLGLKVKCYFSSNSGQEVKFVSTISIVN